MWGIFFEDVTLHNPIADRANLRRVVVASGALVDLLNELYPPHVYPALNATDREIGSWLGQRELVARLNTLRREATSASDGELPAVIQGRSL